MDLFRRIVDKQAVKQRDRIFEQTKDDPEVAHERATTWARILDNLYLGRIALRGKERALETNISLANAAGSNKHAEIPPDVLYNLGLDENIIGTVAYDPVTGANRPRIERLTQWESARNWMALPGPGAVAVAKRMREERQYQLSPIRNILSFMSTPKKTGQAAIDDIVATAELFQALVDGYELNISCPNTDASTGIGDSRDEYQRNLSNTLSALGNLPYLRLKLTPDASREGYAAMLEVASDHPNVQGFVGFNTSKDYEALGLGSFKFDKGGISGKALYPLAFKQQLILVEEIVRKYSSKNWELDACGGIGSVDTMLERITSGEGLVKGIQVYTGLFYKGPRLLTEMRRGLHEYERQAHHTQ